MSNLTKSASNLPLRRNVVPVLFNFENLKVFVGQIHNYKKTVPHHWSTVEGGIEVEASELPHLAARRELREEVGVRKPLFIAALEEPLTYNFEGHPRYSGKSLAVFFYGIRVDTHEPIDLDPWDTEEITAFTRGIFVDHLDARTFLKIGATPERSEFCDRLADRISEVHTAMGFASIRKKGGLTGPADEAFLLRTRQMLTLHGHGFKIDETSVALPPLSPLPKKPVRPTFLRQAAAIQRMLPRQ